MENGVLKGSNRIIFVPDTLLKGITLHSAGLKILNISSSPGDLKYELNNKREELLIHNDFTAGDTQFVKIEYEYDQEYPSEANRKGFYYFKKSEGVLENICYTMSEPSDARFWFPCWDETNDKSTADISIRLNKEYKAASNGNLVEIYKDTDSTRIFRWQTIYPITTYLMSITASKYSNFYDYYVDELSKDTLLLDYYVWKDDSAGVIFNAQKSFKRVPEMIRVFSKKFGPYPFEKYGMASVFPFNFGGEEHQSISTIHRYWLTGNEMGIAHELAHQWWGDLVTCRNWKDIWLNESFATYSEYIWLEGITKDKSELQKKLSGYERYDSDWSKAIYDPEGQGIQLFSSIVYQKGALVLHTLRNIIGDSLFFEVLSEYRNRFKYSYASTEDFVEVLNFITKKEMNWFFDQYIFRAGWPKVLFSWSYDNAAQTLKVILEQDVKNNRDLYLLPLEIKINSITSRIENVYMDGKEKTQEFLFKVSNKPVSIEINPDKKIFVEIKRK